MITCRTWLLLSLTHLIFIHLVGIFLSNKLLILILMIITFARHNFRFTVNIRNILNLLHRVILVLVVVLSSGVNIIILKLVGDASLVMIRAHGSTHRTVLVDKVTGYVDHLWIIVVWRRPHIIIILLLLLVLEHHLNLCKLILHNVAAHILGLNLLILESLLVVL